MQDAEDIEAPRLTSEGTLHLSNAVVALARVSTTQQQSGASLDSQMKEIEELCKVKGLHVIKGPCAIRPTVSRGIPRDPGESRGKIPRDRGGQNPGG